VKLSGFIRKLQTIEEQIGSHPNIDDSLGFWLDGEEIVVDYIEPDQLMGCGCYVGAIINFTLLKQEEND